ncbi:hypothetical protein FBUS_01002 [Fasciolopsis buskii]|uniref:Uncharacterized protein n=1 Tax=Fasciolopsis buskii TaxID=27845 RepID=A0A8E0VM49_9TREM|nr:hypothetical protein FBUS_01002 [Fasciolopsis buski]
MDSLIWDPKNSDDRDSTIYLLENYDQDKPKNFTCVAHYGGEKYSHHFELNVGSEISGKTECDDESWDAFSTLQGIKYRVFILDAEKWNNYFLPYQTVFIKGAYTTTDDVTVKDDDLDVTKNSNYAKLNQTVCSDVDDRNLPLSFQIAQWSTKITILKESSISCTVYGVEKNSEIIIQLSVLDKNLLAQNSHPEQVFSERTLTRWFKSFPLMIQNKEFNPKLISNCE